MIRIIYKNQKLWKAQHALWAIVAFLINSLFVWYVVLKCCFQQLALHPPIPLSVIFLIYTLLDRLYPYYKTKKFKSFRLVLDLVVWILLMLSFYLPDENVVCFLGLPVVIYLFDVVYLKDLIFDMLRRHYWIYKVYIILKIIYWIIMYAHIIGCIFYAVQMNLLNNQTFGPFALNPKNYYQGQLLAYTPILMFNDLNRYVYAMYYSFSLVSTIAFGDIIGKNYIQDIYVAILIVISTVIIALVVQQMYMIFRRKKTRFFELLNKIRFLSERLKGYKQIPSNFRMQIINFLTEISWKHMNEQPEELETAVQFKTKLMRQSVIFNDELPIFYAKYVLHKLKLTHLPKGILVYNNLPQKQQLMSYLVLKGKFWVGYSTLKGRLAGGYTLQKQGMNFGIQQAFVGTNDLYRYLQVRTVTSSSVLTISAKQLRQIMVELEDIEFPYDKPIEHFQNAKDHAMFKRTKYQCSICQTDDHTLIDCSTCHYVVTYATTLQLAKRMNQRGLGYRKHRKSRKIRGIHLETISDKPGKSWRLMQIERYREIFNKIKQVQDQSEMLLQKSHEWAIYAAGFPSDEDLQKKLARTSNFSYTIRNSKII